jgi:hypothetical protein
MTTNTPLSMKERFALLKAPFPSKALEWKIGNRNKENTRGRALPFLQFMAVADRLDDVLGEENWKASYAPGPAGGVVCKLEVRIEGEWICKENGAGNTEMEGIKGGLTDAFKRAATMWGVGRYLHAYDAIGVDIDDKGRFQAPSLPDFLLPAEEVEQNRKDAEAAEIEEKAAAATVAAAIAAGEAGEPGAVAAKPAKPARVPKATKAVEGKAGEDAGAQSVTDAVASAQGVVDGAGESGEPSPAAAAVLAEEALSTEAASIATEIIVDGPADTAPVDTLSDVAHVATEPAAEDVAAEQAAVAEPALAETEAVVAEVTTPVVEDTVIQIGADGVPVMPTSLADVEVKLIAGLVERIAKGGDLRVIRDFAEGAGKKTLGAPAQAYLAARLDYAQKQQDAQESAGEAAAETHTDTVAGTSVAETAVGETVVGESGTPSANDGIIEVDAEGQPVVPANLTEPELKLIKGLVGRIAKGVKLDIVRDYAVNGAGKDVLGTLAQAYVLACVDQAQKDLNAQAQAA